MGIEVEEKPVELEELEEILHDRGWVPLAEYELSPEGLRQLWVGQTVGDFTLSGLTVYAQYGGAKVTQVPVGASFEIHADYQIQNVAAGLTFWTTCMTVWNVTDNVAVEADTAGQHLGSNLRSEADAINATGPSKATTYRIRIWANQAANAGAPDKSQW